MHSVLISVFPQSYPLDFLDTSEERNPSPELLPLPLRPSTTTYKYLNNGLSQPTLLRSPLPPPPPSFSFSTAGATAALTHSRHLTPSSSHLPRPSPSPSRCLSAGIFSSSGVLFHHPSSTAFSLSSPSIPLHSLLAAAAGFHSSAVSCLPDKQKATIEKAVDIVKEKKKKVVDTLTKVRTCILYISWLTC